MSLSGGAGASGVRNEGRSTGGGQTHSSAGHSGLGASRGGRETVSKSLIGFRCSWRR